MKKVITLIALIALALPIFAQSKVETKINNLSAAFKSALNKSSKKQKEQGQLCTDRNQCPYLQWQGRQYVTLEATSTGNKAIRSNKFHSDKDDIEIYEITAPQGQDPVEYAKVQKGINNEQNSYLDIRDPKDQIFGRYNPGRRESVFDDDDKYALYSPSSTEVIRVHQVNDSTARVTIIKQEFQVDQRGDKEDLAKRNAAHNAEVKNTIMEGTRNIRTFQPPMVQGEYRNNL